MQAQNSPMQGYQSLYANRPDKSGLTGNNIGNANLMGLLRNKDYDNRDSILEVFQGKPNRTLGVHAPGPYDPFNRRPF